MIIRKVVSPTDLRLNINELTETVVLAQKQFGDSARIPIQKALDVTDLEKPPDSCDVTILDLPSAVRLIYTWKLQLAEMQPPPE
jgi:hypothetical protein